MEKEEEDKFSKKIVHKIQQEKIKPQPRIYFILKNIMFWLLVLFSISVATIATGTIFYFRESLQDYFFHSLRFSNKIRLISIGLPIFWIALLLSAFYITIKSYRSTKYGYKLPSIILIFIHIIFLAILGTSNFLIDTLETLDTYTPLPRYLRIKPRQEKIWMEPEHGLISGKILSIDITNNTVMIQMLDDSIWTINTSQLSYISSRFRDTRNKNTRDFHDSFEGYEKHMYCDYDSDYDISICNNQHNKKIHSDISHEREFTPSTSVLHFLQEITNTRDNVFIRAEGEIMGTNIFIAEKLFPSFLRNPFDMPTHFEKKHKNKNKDKNNEN